VSSPPEESILLRIFVHEDCRHQRRPLYEAIVLAARKLDLSGATVLYGILGFGQSNKLREGSPFAPSSDRPVVIEIVDRAEKIEAFLPVLDEMIQTGLVTMERARVLSAT
jgi:uncharacterized protein